jgi:hypothetical protein
LIPTKENVKREIRKLVKKARPGDAIWLYYTGHGSQKRDREGDEDDGKDEVLCCSNPRYKSIEYLSDDWLCENFSNRVPAGVEAFVISDCCHSGTLLDLPYRYSRTKRRFTGELKERGKSREHDPANPRVGSVVMISGCRDDQVSMGLRDTGGILTTRIIELLSRHAFVLFF